jgi:L-amino acid N-acyltransferase YncA
MLSLGLTRSSMGRARSRREIGDCRQRFQMRFGSVSAPGCVTTRIAALDSLAQSAIGLFPGEAMTTSGTSTGAIHVRAARQRDAAAIREIYNHYVRETIVTFEEQPVSAGEMRVRIRLIGSLGLPWIVAESDGSVVGYAYANRWKERAAYRHSVETTVYLRTDSTGRGIGRMLYTSLIAELRRLGCHAIIGGIALPNAASVALHESLGFRKVAHFGQVGRKFDRWIDVGYWQLTMDV